MTIIGMDKIGGGLKSMLSGRKIGLITNNMARGENITSALDKVMAMGELKNLTILSPEHGYYGDFQAGATVNSYFDRDLMVNVESLYRIPDSYRANSGDIDNAMRTIDSQKDFSKYPPKELMESFDLILYDLQDVGCRIYTYIATLVYSMEMSQSSDQEFVVFDRPNPITGLYPEGPILQDNLQSFVGALPITMRHSLTIGEIARFHNKFINAGKTNLKVIEMDGWSRELWFDQTGLPWIMPSPNMPALDTATIYPGTVLMEGTNVSEGRGTTRPFQIIGAPWINGVKLRERINNLNLPGVRSMEIKFKPSFSKYNGEVCSGIYIVITDRGKFRPFKFALNLIRVIMDLYPGDFQFHDSYFDRASGNVNVREMLSDGYSADDISESYAEEVEKYNRKIEEIKIYK